MRAESGRRFLTGRLGFDSLVVPVCQDPDPDPQGPEMKEYWQTGGRRARSTLALSPPQHTGLPRLFFLIWSNFGKTVKSTLWKGTNNGKRKKYKKDKNAKNKGHHKSFLVAAGNVET